MEDSDSHTDSLRAEQGEPADDESSEAGDTPMSLGSMIRGPIGREVAGEQNVESDAGRTDREAAERREK